MLCHYAECHNADCRYAECHGARPILIVYSRAYGQFYKKLRAVKYNSSVISFGVSACVLSCIVLAYVTTYFAVAMSYDYKMLITLASAHPITKSALGC